VSVSKKTPRPSAAPQASKRAKLRDLRMALWLNPFITDGDTRAQLLELADAIGADIDRREPAACGGVR